MFVTDFLIELRGNDTRNNLLLNFRDMKHDENQED